MILNFAVMPGNNFYKLISAVHSAGSAEFKVKLIQINFFYNIYILAVAFDSVLVEN